jgi:hypothetical protein
MSIPPQSFPKCISVYKGRSPLTLHQYTTALFFCQADPSLKPPSLQSWSQSNRFLQQYQEKARRLDYAPCLPLPSPVRVRSGKPVQTDMLKTLRLCLDISPSTSDFCSFEHAKSTGQTTLVIDESKLDCALPEGLYRASVVIEASPEVWDVKRTLKKDHVINSSAQCLVHLLLMLDGFEAPAKSKQDKSRSPAAQDSDVFARIRFYVSDFKKTFNI